MALRELSSKRNIIQDRGTCSIVATTNDVYIHRSGVRLYFALVNISRETAAEAAAAVVCT